MSNFSDSKPPESKPPARSITPGPLPALDSRSPLAGLSRAYADLNRRARLILTVSPFNSGSAYPVQMLGILGARRSIMICAPTKTDGSLIAVTKDSLLECEWASPTAVYRFKATIASLLFQPLPIVVLNKIQHVKRNVQRNEARALTSLTASLRTPEPRPALVTDLSMRGARVAIDETRANLEAGSVVELSLRPTLFGQQFMLTLTGKLSNLSLTESEQHPGVRFLGLQFDPPAESAQLVLYALIQECLVRELDVAALLFDHED